MHLTFVAAALATGSLLLMPAPADAACCDQKHDHAAIACCDKAEMTCCDKEINVIDLLAGDPELTPAPPVRQMAEVWFHRPVMVGRSVLQGRYIIEHDNDRMARGEPCTHVYAYDNPKRPVVAFHCTHLERERASKNLVALASLGDGWQRLTEFQYAGDTASHGVPAVR